MYTKKTPADWHRQVLQWLAARGCVLMQNVHESLHPIYDSPINFGGVAKVKNNRLFERLYLLSGLIGR